MNVVRQLAQAILVLGLLGCVARLLAVAIGNHRVQGDHVAAAEDRPSWICDHDGATEIPQRCSSKFPAPEPA